ncbi:MAG: MGMT family protein [Candidatus Omnitrophica bacterium]|jgi:O-6-methylguanine DNA methyltransferase|nr:MGMT family protein [Candidatus Omnitrophota bacterium]
MTDFQIKVYKAVLGIPFGQVRTYKWVARKIGLPLSSRAVGQALKRNPYLIIIPCHRVIASSGKLGGYSQGANKKRLLIDLERQILKQMV